MSCHIALHYSAMPAACLPNACLQQAAYFAEQTQDVHVGCVVVSNATMALAVHEECVAWMRSLSSVMQELDAAAISSMRQRMAMNAAALQAQPAGLDELKGILQVMTALRLVVRPDNERQQDVCTCWDTCCFLVNGWSLLVSTPPMLL